MKKEISDQEKFFIIADRIKEIAKKGEVSEKIIRVAIFQNPYGPYGSVQSEYEIQNDYGEILTFTQAMICLAINFQK